MSVDTGEYFAPRRSETEVQATCSVLPRIVHDAKVRYVFSHRLHKLARAVVGVAVDDDHLEAVARVLLRRQAAQAALDVTVLVSHRNDDGDEGLGGLVRHVNLWRVWLRSTLRYGSTSITVCKRLQQVLIEPFHLGGVLLPAVALLDEGAAGAAQRGS